MTDGKYSVEKIKAVHIPFCCTYVAIDANAKVICERILTIEDDSKKSVDRGKSMLVNALLEDEAQFKIILNQDSTPAPTFSEITTFLESEKCCICDKNFQWGKCQDNQNMRLAYIFDS